MPPGLTPCPTTRGPAPSTAAAWRAATPGPRAATPLSPARYVVTYCESHGPETILPPTPNAEEGAGGLVFPVPRFLSLNGGEGTRMGEWHVAAAELVAVTQLGEHYR